MKEEQIYLYSTPEGINLIEGYKMPPVYHSEDWYKKYSESHNHASPKLSYQADLQAAKESSVPIQDQERAKKMIELLLYEKRKELTFQDISSLDVMANVIYGPFTVGYEIKTMLSHGWVPSYNDPDNINGHPNAEPMEVAILYEEAQQETLVDQLAEAKARIAYLEGLINSPEINSFIEGVKIESTHQTERWGLQEEYMPGHFVMVANKLLGKMCVDIWDGKTDKFKHHCIALAAVMFNVHRQIDKKGTATNYCFYGSDQKVAILYDDTPEKEELLSIIKKKSDQRDAEDKARNPTHEQMMVTAGVPEKEPQEVSITVSQSAIPKNARLVEAYETEHRIIVMFASGEEIPEDHNCDRMGCGSFSHVKYILTKPDSSK